MSPLPCRYSPHTAFAEGMSQRALERKDKSWWTLCQFESRLIVQARMTQSPTKTLHGLGLQNRHITHHPFDMYLGILYAS